ncbi:hypothetical protein ABZ484_15295 [Streptomyces sp. NPDC006393]|uniref:hypothetical protein n=1 Tax=Streptomyces sp. NPDC006393 TaxID=3156763 RepID=UPI0033F9B94F
MTVPAALPAAVLRVMRTAAGRRALQLVLLVGAVFALGFLCGERAQAAEGGPRVPSPTAVLNAVTGRDAAPDRPDHGQERMPALPVRDHVVRPATDVAAVKAEAETKANARVPAAVSLPTLPTQPVPSSPPLPDLPDLPALSALSGLPDTPVTGSSGLGDLGSVLPLPALPSLPASVTLPVSVALPAPVTLPVSVDPTVSEPRPQHVPQQPAGAAVATPAGHRADGHRAQGHARTAERVVGPAAVITFGPESAHRLHPLYPQHPMQPLSGQVATHGTSRAVHDPSAAPHAPAPPLPGGDPDGVVGTRSTADSGEPIHGDLHAVTPGGRAPLPRMRSTATPLAAAGTRDVREDVPVYPG